jgi:hypothetical protein
MKTTHLQSGFARALVLAAGAALGSSATGAAEVAQSAAARSADTEAAARSSELESAFWTCDHAATTGPMHPADAINCGAVTEALKRAKFGGDLELMLRWWGANKAAQHGRLERTGRLARDL